MIIELIGTWIIIGFFSAIGWNVADETVNKPHLDPWLEKVRKGDAPTTPAAPVKNTSADADTNK